MTTLARLAAIPDLAALVWTARATPHRAPGHKTHTKITGSPMPPEVAAWDMLRPDESGLLHELTQAVRVVVEDMRAADVWEPEPADRPTWASECGFLVATAHHWQCDPFAHEFVRDATKTVHRALSRWVGEQPPPALACTRCGNPVHRGRHTADGEAQTLACSGCGRIWHPADLAHEATMRTPQPLPVIADMLGRSERTLQRWVNAGLIQPVTDHQPTPRDPALYLPAEVAPLAAMVRGETG